MTDIEIKDKNLSLEIIKFRNELFTTQKLLQIRDEEMIKSKENFNECENSLKISENSNNLLVQELHNVRSKLNQIEADYESSRSHYAELDRAR